MEIIICGDISGYAEQVGLAINKMSRNSYDQLCSIGYLDKHPYDLFLIDDDNFDVQYKRIVNVALPENESDAINLTYLKNNYIGIEEHKYHPLTKIVSENNLSCISSDSKIYTKNMGRQDWTVIEVNPLCSFNLSDFYIDYQTTGVTEASKGFALRIRGKSNIFRTGEKDETKHELTSIVTDDSKTYQNIYFRAIRNSWSKTDSLVKKSEISACLSGIDSTSQLPDVIDALLKLKNL